MKNQIAKKWLSAMLVASAGLITREIIDLTWKESRDEPAPKNPNRAGVSSSNALLWAVGVAIVGGISRFAARKYLVKDVEN